jgi:hypothetical protein
LVRAPNSNNGACAVDVASFGQSDCCMQLQPAASLPSGVGHWGLASGVGCCWPQVLEGGLRFFQTVRPPFVMAECNDGMMIKATGRPASAFLLKASLAPVIPAGARIWLMSIWMASCSGIDVQGRRMGPSGEPQSSAAAPCFLSAPSPVPHPAHLDRVMPATKAATL